MNVIVKEIEAAILALCKQYHVKHLELFGSAVSGAFDATSSDVDFLVEFMPLAPGQRADAYFGLLEGFESVLQRPVDLVSTTAVRNPYFLQAIQSTRTTLYAA